MTDDLTRLLRSSIDENVSGLDRSIRPAAAVAGTVQQVAARHRRNRIALVGAAAAVVLVAGVGVQAGSFPLAGTDPTQPAAPSEPEPPAPPFQPSPSVVSEPGEPPPDENAPSALDTGVVRGNLSGDDRWLSQLREHVARSQGYDDEAVHVLYAADVDRWRTALVEVPGRPSATVSGRQQIWFTGPRGAAAEDVKQHGPPGGRGSEATRLLWGADGIQRPAGPVGRMAHVVVTAGGPAPKVTNSPTITALGTLSWPIRTLKPVAPGVYEDVVDIVGWGSYYVSLGNAEGWVQPIEPDSSASPSLAQGLGAPVYPTGSGTAAPASPDAALVAQGFAQIRVRYGVDVATLPRRLLWTGRMRGIGEMPDSDVTILAVVLPSGAVAVAKLDGYSSGITTVLRPAGPLDRLMLATGYLGNDLPFMEVLVPRGTTQLRVEDRGRVTTVPVQGSGVVSVRHDFGPDAPEDSGGRVRVTALNAAGAPIASVNVNAGVSVGQDVYPPRRKTS